MDSRHDRADAQRVDTWISAGEYEGQHFEVKGELDLGTRKATVEVLKDLTSMGNGGGGTVVFGIAERKENGRSRADHVTPITDRTLVTRLADVVADCVRPSLVWTTTVVEHGGGFVLIVDIQRSPLGPYMVENLKEFRYAIRIGDRTDTMPEQLVRDAYARAALRRDRLAEQWEAAHLPIEPSRNHWPLLTTSAMPENPHDAYCDPARVDPNELPLPVGEHAGAAGLLGLATSLHPWADGFIATGDALSAPDVTFSPSAPQATLRLHRNGAVGHALHPGTGSETDILRALAAQLKHTGEHWRYLDIAAGTVRLELLGLGQLPKNVQIPPLPEPDRSRREPYAGIRLQLEVRTQQLCCAKERHGLVRGFANRLANVYGRSRATVGFDVGRLYQPGRATELVAFASHIHWTGIAHSQDLVVCTDNAVRRAENTQAIAFWRDGLLLDLEGNAVAAVEFCDAPGLPDNFDPGDLDAEPVDDPDHRTREPPAPDNPPEPHPTGRWVDAKAEDVLRSP